jgi:hypothetical protein
MIDFVLQDASHLVDDVFGNLATFHVETNKPFYPLHAGLPDWCLETGESKC